MEKQICEARLTSDESGMMCIVQHHSNTALVTYKFETQSIHTIYETTGRIAAFVEQEDSYVVLRNEQLIQINKVTLLPTVMRAAQYLQQLSPSAYVYVHNGECFEVINGVEKSIGHIEHLYKTTGQFYMFKKNQSIFYRLDGQAYEFTLDFELESAALSMDHQCIAMFGQHHGMRQLFVYNIEQKTIQNMTEMLDEAIGFDQSIFSVEAPSWTETNAFYFLVNANNEVRLYYGDLYGNLLPASPEEERISAYAIAKSGNWAVTAAFTTKNTYKIAQLDITTGEETLINL